MLPDIHKPVQGTTDEGRVEADPPVSSGHLWSEARFYEKAGHGSVRCFLCGHHCLIPPGRKGVCGVRQNVDGKLYTLVYGHPVSRGADPIEKKPLYHFLPGSWAYSIGTLGCRR